MCYMLPKYKLISILNSIFSEKTKSHAAKGKPKGITIKASAWLKAVALRMPRSRWLYNPKPLKSYNLNLNEIKL